MTSDDEKEFQKALDELGSFIIKAIKPNSDVPGVVIKACMLFHDALTDSLKSGTPLADSYLKSLEIQQ